VWLKGQLSALSTWKGVKGEKKQMISLSDRGLGVGMLRTGTLNPQTQRPHFMYPVSLTDVSPFLRALRPHHQFISFFFLFFGGGFYFLLGAACFEAHLSPQTWVQITQAGFI
jgi:hypothetical protein